MDYRCNKNFHDKQYIANEFYKGEQGAYKASDRVLRNSNRNHNSSSFSAVDVLSDNGGSPFEDINKGENVFVSKRRSWQDPQPKIQSQNQCHLRQDQHHQYSPATNKKSEQVDNTILQDTKNNNLHILVASILTIAGVALGVAIAAHLEIQ